MSVARRSVIRRVAFATSLLAAGCWTQHGRAEDLNQAWAIAMGANQRLQSEQTSVQADAEALAAERSARLPSINSTTGVVYFGESPRFSSRPTEPAALSSTSIVTPLLGGNQSWLPVSLTMATHPLYTSGRIRGSIDAAESQLGARRASEVRTGLDLKLAVAESYVEILRGRRRLEVARGNVAQLDSFTRDVANRLDQGVATRNDWLAADVALANARLREVQAVTALDVAWSTYNRYLRRPPFTQVALDELTAAPSGPVGGDPSAVAMEAGSRGPSAELDSLLDRALRARPELAELAHQGRALEAKSRVAGSANKPQVAVGAGLLYAGSQSLDPQTNFLGTAFVNWNLFDGGAARRRSNSYDLQRSAVMRQRADAADEVALQVHTQWSKLQEAKVSIGVARHAVGQSEENIRVVLDRYAKEVSTYTEVLDAETRRLESLTRFYDAFYDKSLAEFRLGRAVGDL